MLKTIRVEPSIKDTGLVGKENIVDGVSDCSKVIRIKH